MTTGKVWLKVGLALALGSAAAQTPAAGQILARGPAAPVMTAQAPALPQAPGFQRAPTEDAAGQVKAAGGGLVEGVVEDESGAVVAGARVTLVSDSGTKMEAESGSDGSFQFPGVAAGSFTLTVTSEGMETATVSRAATDAATALAPIVLRVATVSTQVNAVSQWEAAEIEIHDEEKQRLLWVLPNFYVSYVENAAPLTAGQKFRLAGRTVVDPEVFVSAGVTAGIEQGLDQYRGFGQGAKGYARRYGANYGDSFIGIYLGGAVLPTVFHQDPRYFYKGTGGFGTRLWYVVSRAVVQKGDNGRWQPGYSNLLGDLGSALLSDAYYPVQVKSWGSLTAETFGISIAGDAVSNLLQEFVYARWTSKKKQ